MPDLEALDGVIAELQTALNRLDRIEAREQGVGSMEDLQVLRLVLEGGPARVGAIADLRGAGKATVSARLDRLEKKGYLVRERIDGDRRGVVSVLTDEGRRVAEQSRTRRRELLTSALDATSPERLEELVGVLLPRVATG